MKTVAIAVFSLLLLSCVSQKENDKHYSSTYELRNDSLGIDLPAMNVSNAVMKSIISSNESI